MADEPTSSVSAPEAPPTPVEQAPQASQSEPRPQTPVPAQETQDAKPVNLQEFPEFKQYQRQTNQTIEQIRSQSQTKIQQLEQQLEQIATRDMTDEELSQRELQKMGQLVAEKDEQYKQLYQTYARDLAMNEIARKTGVDSSVLADADNPDEAWELATQTALEQQKAQLESEYKDKLASSPGNTPDLGAAKPPVPAGVSGDVPHFETNSDLVGYYRKLYDEWNE